VFTTIATGSMSWTPAMVGTGVVAGVILAVKLLPWSSWRSHSNGNGNGKFCGAMHESVDELKRAAERTQNINDEQWTEIQQNRVDIAGISQEVKNVVDGLGRVERGQEKIVEAITGLREDR